MTQASSDSAAELLAVLHDVPNGSTRRQFLRNAGVLAGTVSMSGVVAQILAACGSTSTTAPSKIVKGGTITYGNVSDVNELIPQQRPSLNADWLIQTLMFDSLVAIDTSGNLVPQLAESLATFSSDGLTATFKLRKGVKWTDGTPVTADDVVFSYNLHLMDQYSAWNSPSRATNQSFIKEVVAIDASTVQFTAKQLDTNFVTIGDRLIAPKHVLGSLTGAQLNTDGFNKKPSVTFGAFKFNHWDVGSQVVLDANKDYYLGAPNVNHFVYLQISANQNEANLLQTGAMDWGGVTLTDYAHLSSINTLKLETFAGHDDIDVILMNLDPAKPYYKMFGDVAVRQALYHAVNRQGMIQPVYDGQAVVVNGIILKGSWAYNDSVTPQYDYDPTKAEALLDGAGWTKGADGIRAKDGVQLAWDLHGYNLAEFTNMAQICQQNWNAIGCKVTLHLADVNTTVAELLNSRDFPMMIIDFGPNVVTPDIRIYVLGANAAPGGINGEHIVSDQLDTLMAKAASTLSKTDAKPIWDQIQNLMAENAWLIPLVSRNAVWAVNKRVQASEFSIYTSSVQGLPWINKVWVSDGK